MGHFKFRVRYIPHTRMLEFRVSPYVSWVESGIKLTQNFQSPIHSGPIELFLPEPQSLAFAYCGIRWFLVLPADVRTSFSRSFTKVEIAQNVVPLTCVDQRHLEFLVELSITNLAEAYRTFYLQIYSGSKNLATITWSRRSCDHMREATSLKSPTGREWLP